MRKIEARILLCSTLAVASAHAQTPRSEDVVHERWAEFEPRFERHTCPRSDQQYDSARVTCGYVLVPEDRTDPDSRLIKLSGMKIAAAQATSPELAIALLLPGGPGGPTIDFIVDALLVDGRIPPFGERSDIIAFDQRGIGYSEPRLCRGIARPQLRGVPTVPDGEARYGEDLRRCLDEARAEGVAVDSYSTWHSALDVRDVRRALGYARWNIWGGSYGTRLGQAVMQLDPSGVRAAILDSVLPAVYSDDAGPALGLRASLEALQQACAADARCTLDAGDFVSKLEAALDAYGDQPLILEQLDESVFEGGRLVVDGELIAAVLFVALYSHRAHASLPTLATALENRDVDGLHAFFGALLGAFGANESFGIGLNLVTNCRSDHFDLSAATRAREPLTRFAIEFGLGDGAAERCAAAYRVDPDPSVAVLQSDIPTLVLSGLMDPGTPPPLARAILPGLPNARLIEVPFAGHGVVPELEDFSRGCGDRLVADFVANPGSAVEVSCMAAIGPPRFLTNPRATRRSERFLSSIRSGARPVAPALAVAGLLFALVAFPVAAVGRRIDGRAIADPARVRLLAWLGALLSLAAGVVAAAALALTVRDYLFALPFGVLPWIRWAGWLSLAGVVAAMIAAVQCLRGRKEMRRGIGTMAGVWLTALLTIAFLVFLVGIGAGPV